MIARISGILDALDGNSALVRPEGGLVYEVLVSAYTAGRLGGSIGQPVTLQTFHWMQSDNQGTTLVPRLAGFLSSEDRRFFELFTTCKGIGNRRALRSMAISTAQIAAAIADRDVAMLTSLPEIGKRTAETIVATLSGKVDGFLQLSVPGPAPGSSGSGGAHSGGGGLAREALEVLAQLGENRTQALNWIEQVLSQKDRPRDVQDLVSRVYQLKAGT